MRSFSAASRNASGPRRARSTPSASRSEIDSAMRLTSRGRRGGQRTHRKFYSMIRSTMRLPSPDSFARTLAAALLLHCSLAAAQLPGFVDPRLRWRTLDTEHFSVHFAEQNAPQARLAAQVAEKVYPRITGMLRWQPRTRTHLIVLDSADFSNGFATPLPFNHTGIFLSPPDEGELLQ